MTTRAQQLAEQRRKEFAIRCRDVRLYIAAHPGISEYELSQKFGKRVDFALGKMIGMGIIRWEQILSDTGITKGWFVVPQ